MTTVLPAKMLVLLAMLVLPVAASAEERFSGFLLQYPEMQDNPEVPGTLIWRQEGGSLSAYDKVLIEPIEIWIHPDSKYKGINPDEMKVLTETLRKALIDRLEPDYPVVDRTGKGVLGLRLAIVDVNLQDKKRSLLGYTPIGFVATTAANAMGMRMALNSAGVEAELYDAGNQQRLVVMVDRKLGDEIAKAEEAQKDEKKAKQIDWETVQQSLDFYAQRLRTALDRDRAR